MTSIVELRIDGKHSMHLSFGNNKWTQRCLSFYLEWLQYVVDGLAGRCRRMAELEQSKQFGLKRCCR